MSGPEGGGRWRTAVVTVIVASVLPFLAGTAQAQQGTQQPGPQPWAPPGQVVGVVPPAPKGTVPTVPPTPSTSVPPAGTAVNLPLPDLPPLVLPPLPVTLPELPPLVSRIGSPRQPSRRSEHPLAAGPSPGPPAVESIGPPEARPSQLQTQAGAHAITPAKVAAPSLRRPVSVGSPSLVQNAAETVDKFSFPLVLTALVVLFLLLQALFDRRDPKLAAAPMTDELYKFR